MNHYYFICLISIILSVLFDGYSSLSTTIDRCNNVCQSKNSSLISQTWCCQLHEICDEVIGQCKDAPGIRWLTYLKISLLIIFISLCLIKFLKICFISHSITIRPNEESPPPSYEEFLLNQR